jgi:hypothetical protein
MLEKAFAGGRRAGRDGKAALKSRAGLMDAG